MSPRAAAGAIAGSAASNGYWRIRIDGFEYLAHRLAWLLTHGRWPADQIDHINGERADNRLCNLREATPSQNRQNLRRAMRKNRSSGLLGASWDKAVGRWKSSIAFDGKQRHLGYFESAEAAHSAYMIAKRQMHPFGEVANQLR